ncbi:MAG: hypothetical protein V1796_01410 [Pseudomonadota bacterium]
MAQREQRPRAGFAPGETWTDAADLFSVHGLIGVQSDESTSAFLDYNEDLFQTDRNSPRLRAA